MVKLNLLLNDEKKLLNSHKNISVFKLQNKYNLDYVEGEINNLDWIVENGEVDEIIADCILEYFPFNQIYHLLDNWCKKLSLTGKIVLVGTDVRELARLITFDEIKPDEFYPALYGKQVENWETKKSCTSVNDMISLLRSLNMVITKKYFDKYNFIIEAKRGN